MKPGSSPIPPEKTAWEKLDRAFRKSLTVSKEELLKEEARMKRQRAGKKHARKKSGPSGFGVGGPHMLWLARAEGRRLRARQEASGTNSAWAPSLAILTTAPKSPMSDWGAFRRL